MVKVSFQPSGRSLVVPAGTTLLEAVVGAGLPIARGCGADGLCGRCGVLLLAGADAVDPESDEESATKRRNRIDPAVRLACRTHAHGDVQLTASYW